MSRRPIDFVRLRGIIQPIDALRLCGWRPVSSRGELHRGPCPLHGSHSTESRSLAVSSRVVYCHVCHGTSDAVGLYARYYRLGPYEAALELCQRLNLDVPYLDGRR